MLTIDGARGEGGGQILRTSLALAAITGQPVRLHNIRARRSKPGLMRQHLTAVQAAAAISGGSVEGAAVGAQELVFRPGTVRGGDYRFSVGTAGSAALVCQTVLPALLRVREPSSLCFEGGTHNPHSPPFDFLERAFLPLLRRMGPKVQSALEQPGFYPAGGGRFRISVEPCAKLTGFELIERGALVASSARALVSCLPKSIADRELRHLAQRLNFERQQLRCEMLENAHGPGNIVLIEFESVNVTEVITGFGERGVPAEQVAEAAATEALTYLASNVPVGVHLADQLLLPLALAGGGAFRSLAPSLHTQTQAEIIHEFLGTTVRMQRVQEGAWHYQVER